MNLVQITPPAVQPVTLEMAREHLRVIDDGEDDLINGLIEAATSHIDARHGILGRALITQTWEMTVSAPFPSEMELPFPPLQEVVFVHYQDRDGNQQIFDPAGWMVWPGEHSPAIRRVPGVAWPDADRLVIRFVCGFGDNPADVPMAIRQAMLLLIGHWHENRSEVEACELTQIPMASEALLSPYRVKELAL